ncbi:hypothetical protein D9M69_589190 [compost metagenome]
MLATIVSRSIVFIGRDLFMFLFVLRINSWLSKLMERLIGLFFSVSLLVSCVDLGYWKAISNAELMSFNLSASL